MLKNFKIRKIRILDLFAWQWHCWKILRFRATIYI